MQVVGADVAGDQVEVVVEGARPVLDLEQPVGGVRVRVRAAVDDLRAVHRQAARVLGVGALVGHEEPQAAYFRVGNRVERVQVTAVQLDPFVPDVVRGHRVLDRQQRHYFMMPVDYFAVRAEDEADVEETPGEFGVAGFRLCHHEGVPLPGEPAQVIRLRARDVDRALPRERFVVEVEDLVVEALQGAFGDGYQAHRQVHAGQPRRGLDQVRDVLQVHRDLTAVTDAAHGGDQAHGLIRLDHGYSLSAVEPLSRAGPLIRCRPPVVPGGAGRCGHYGQAGGSPGG